MENIANIILENENLIYSIASKFTKYKNKEDLFQVGCIGIIEAYKNFDPNKQTKFTTYAYQYIYGEMSKYIREDHNVKLSRDLSKLKYKIEKAKTLLTQKFMRSPTNKELSDYLEIEEDKINQILNYNDTFSIDDSYQEDFSFHEIIADKVVDYDILLDLKTEIENLEEPERTIMIERYYQDLTQMQIANNLGLTQVDVSRREKKTLKKLRKIFN